MEYVFGKINHYGKDVENLKTIGDRHSDLTGSVEVIRSYIYSTIVDNFVVVEKYDSKEDAEGNCYDWYIIDKHYRYVDYSPKHEAVFSSLLGSPSSDTQAAEQTRRALQLFAGTLTDEQAMEVATIYDAWSVGKAYCVGEFLTYGVNDVGDPQLYKVAQAHTSQEDWLPSENPALYTAIGLDEHGYPVWSQPTGAHDAYNEGDIVDYNGKLYKSLVDGNVYSPDAYPVGWEEVTSG